MTNDAAPLTGAIDLEPGSPEYVAAVEAQQAELARKRAARDGHMPTEGSNHYRVRIPGLADSIVPGQARLVAGAPTGEEIAAITSVFGILFAEGALVDRPRDTVPRLSPWQRTQRTLQGGVSADDPLRGSFGRD